MSLLFPISTSNVLSALFQQIRKEVSNLTQNYNLISINCQIVAPPLSIVKCDSDSNLIVGKNLFIVVTAPIAIQTK